MTHIVLQIMQGCPCAQSDRREVVTEAMWPDRSLDACRACQTLHSTERSEGAHRFPVAVVKKGTLALVTASSSSPVVAKSTFSASTAGAGTATCLLASFSAHHRGAVSGVVAITPGAGAQVFAEPDSSEQQK